MSSETTISHEPVDDIPVIVEWLLNMQVDKLIDKILPKPHGNWKGLIYGQVIVIWLVFILSQADHRTCAVEKWVGDRVTVLRRCTNWEVAPNDLGVFHLKVRPISDRVCLPKPLKEMSHDFQLGKHMFVLSIVLFGGCGAGVCGRITKVYFW